MSFDFMIPPLQSEARLKILIHKFIENKLEIKYLLILVHLKKSKRTAISVIKESIKYSRDLLNTGVKFRYIDFAYFKKCFIYLLNN